MAVMERIDTDLVRRLHWERTDDGRQSLVWKEWLVTNGVEASRIEIMSLGEEQPAAEGEGEFVWSQNRRAEFEPMAGGRE